MRKLNQFKIRIVLQPLYVSYSNCQCYVQSAAFQINYAAGGFCYDAEDDLVQNGLIAPAIIKAFNNYAVPRSPGYEFKGTCTDRIPVVIFSGFSYCFFVQNVHVAGADLGRQC